MTCLHQHLESLFPPDRILFLAFLGLGVDVPALSHEIG
ncbi:Putative protein of unknown function [Podospora comata]|uniref:Uncharacterized protein n=1 Tax=Podospora comata TaxID=48703 RepID=A0ABY6RW05_PODCO|nr:Putative protein of unknown function [Podospora comata]